MAWQDRALLHGTTSIPEADSVDEHLAAMPGQTGQIMPPPLPRRQWAMLAIAAAFLFSLAVMGSTGRGGGGAGVVLDDQDGALSMEKKCGPAHDLFHLFIDRR